MKKILLSLVLSNSVISGMSYAWTPGDFTGSVAIGGTLVVDDFRQKWEWMAGSNAIQFNNRTGDLASGGTTLNIVADKNYPILVGRTKEAFNAGSGTGSIPKISFSDYQKRTVAPVFTASGQDGTGSLVIPVINKDLSPIGQVKINMTAMGARMKADVPNHRGVAASIYSDTSAYIFFGGVPTSSGGAMFHGNTAANFIFSMGGLNSSDMLKQITAADPTITSAAASTYSYRSTMNEGLTSATYAMGVKQSQLLVLTFTNPVRQETVWKAPLNVSVTYQ